MVSIIIPFYNAEKYLEEAIKSVEDQTFTDWELLLINDASTDASPKIAEEYTKKDKRVKFIDLQKNKGTGAARNCGIEAATGDKIAFLDADDRWKPEKLKVQLDFMHKYRAACCYSSYELMDESGKLLNKKVNALSRLSYKKLERANYIGNLTAIYDVKQLGKLYAPQMRKRQDWALWLDVLKKIKIAYGVQESLAFYRIRENSVSRNKWKLLAYNYQVYRKHLGYPTALSLYKMILFLKEQFFIKPKRIIRLPLL